MGEREGGEGGALGRPTHTYVLPLQLLLVLLQTLLGQ